MGKVLFLKSSSLENVALNNKINERIGSFFMAIHEEEVRKAVEAGDISLIIIYLKNVSDKERHRLG